MTIRAGHEMDVMITRALYHIRLSSLERSRCAAVFGGMLDSGIIGSGKAAILINQLSKETGFVDYSTSANGERLLAKISRRLNER